MTELICRLSGNQEPQYFRGDSGFFPVGMELEFEGQFSPTPGVSGWRTTDDGSLRNGGIEYLSYRPVASRERSVHNLRNLYLYVQDAGLQVNIRTAMHIHVNMQDLSPAQVRSILLAYCLVEPAMFSYVGRSRDINPYCIPWYAAPQTAVRALSGLWYMENHADNGTYMARQRLNRTNKYSALFPGPMSSFGSIEFRQLLTPSSAEEAVEWLDIVQATCSLGVERDYAELVLTEDIDELALDAAALVGLSGHESSYQEVDSCAAIYPCLPWLGRPVPEDKWVMVYTETSGSPNQEGDPPRRHASLEAYMRRSAEFATIRQPPAGNPQHAWIEEEEIFEDGEEDDDEWYSEEERI